MPLLIPHGVSFSSALPGLARAHFLPVIVGLADPNPCWEVMLATAALLGCLALDLGLSIGSGITGGCCSGRLTTIERACLVRRKDIRGFCELSYEDSALCLALEGL
jgi:hypothetical protein